MATKKFDTNNLGTGILGKDIFGEQFSDDIFKGKSTTEEPADEKEGAILVDIARLYPSPRNPYKVDESSSEMMQLVASIKKEGVINPLIVRKTKMGEGYEIISGHRRRAACKIAGIDEVPVIVKDLSDEEADCYMVDLNLNRENILPSEKAKAIRLKYDAIKRSVGKPKDGEERTGASAEEIAKEMGMGSRMINSYLRLSELSDAVLDAVDDKTINIKTGVQMSYLSDGVQRAALAGHKGRLYSLDEAKVKLIRKEYEGEEDANPSDIAKLFAPKKKAADFKISQKMRKRYFPKDMSDEEVESIIRNLVRDWAKENNPNYNK